MKKNRVFFNVKDANEWFKRNQILIPSKTSDKPIQLLAEWLHPFKTEISNILEIGCGNGQRLNILSQTFNANGYGIEPSSDALKYIKEKFPNLIVNEGFGDDIPLRKKFDLVHLGFFLYLVDRELYLSCISEADRLVKFGGFLSIIDFETPFPFSNKYSHKNGLFSYKQNNSEVFVASGLYSVVNKFHFSHNEFYFHKGINERLSLTLLYKETDIFKKS